MRSKYFKTKLTGILFSGFAFIGNVYASEVMSPTVISITQNAQVNLTLSNTDINKIFVHGEKITAITKPNGLFNSNNDHSGNVYATINGQSPFTVFVSTNLGLHFSLLITPKSEPGQTIEFSATGFTGHTKHHKNTPIVRHSRVAQAFEQSSSYEKTLVNLIRDVMLQKTPPGYTQISSKAFSQIPEFCIPSSVMKGGGLKQSVKAGFLGGSLAVRVLSVKNNSSHAVELFANQFYNRGVRAVAISQEYLPSATHTFVFEVISND